MSRISSGCASPFLLFWLLGWSGFTLLFDGMSVWAIAQGLHSLSFVETTGEITHSKVITNATDEGVSYTADVRYKYVVANVEFEGDRIQTALMEGPGNEAQATVVRLPVGRKTSVFYDKRNPGYAVLQKGLTAGDLFMPLFLTPFNVIMVGMFYWLVGRGVRRRVFGWPERIAVRRRGDTQRVRLLRYSPLAAAGIAALAISFVSIFVVGIGSMFLPMVVLSSIAWMAVLAGAVWAYFQFSVVDVEVELDAFRHSLTVRQGAEKPKQFRYSELMSIDSHLPLDADDAEEIDAQAAVKFTPRHGGGDELIIECKNAERADWLAAWLRERVFNKGPFDKGLVDRGIVDRGIVDEGIVDEGK